MKVTITREELRQVLTGYFRTEVEDFTIVVTRPSEMGLKIREEIKLINVSGVSIVNAKLLRDLAEKNGSPIGLQDTAWALKNWAKFLEFVDTYNRFPERGFGSKESEGVMK